MLLTLLACSPGHSGKERRYQKGEFIYRLHHEQNFVVSTPKLQSITPYPWEQGHQEGIPKVTKDFFRCKGCSLNPVQFVKENGVLVRYADCGGIAKHSLPLREGKEFIYPILIDLLNYIQVRANNKVVITSGHRCPEHNAYVDSSASNSTSKHLVGAEVSFYVQGFENNPELVVEWILDFYKERHDGKKDYLEFMRYEKQDLNIKTPPWYNKELFIKVFKRDEGRNFDNRHPYPYLSIQVRYDPDKKERVIYSWDKSRNYLRY